jgi:hypothetical protein
MPRSGTWTTGSLGSSLEIGKNTGNRGGTRVASVSKVEHKAWIANDIAAETGGGRVIPAQVFLDLSEQIHVTLSL